MCLHLIHLLFTKLGELLAINPNLFKRRIILVQFHAFELYSAIWLSSLSRMSGFLWYSSKWAPLVQLFPSRNIRD